MQFLKTLFWVLIAVVLALFGSRNWSDVTLSLWGDIQADIKLPILLLITFLLGFVPLYAWHRLMRWHEYKKRVAAERALAAAIVAPPVPVAEGTLNPAQAD